MPHDIRFEAAYLRAAILIGLIHERAAPEWAESRIGRIPLFAGALADVLVANVELTAIREALRPIAEGAVDEHVSAALLTTIRREIVEDGCSVTRTIERLSQLRRDCVNSPAINDAIKSFENRMMLADAGVSTTEAPGRPEVETWLSTVSTAGHYLFVFDGAAELAAFVGAVSRKVVRDRTLADEAGNVAPRVWASRSSAAHDLVAVLNESAARIVSREFSPVPFASTIPYAAVDRGLALVIDSPRALALGVEDAAAALAG